MELAKLTTEKRNPKTMNLDKMRTMDILKTINEEDKQVADAVEAVLSKIEMAVNEIYRALTNNGKLYYVGAGTSGRLAVLDASECPPTFMTSSDMVQPVMAGGMDAFLKAVEGAEDSEAQGKADVKARNVTDRDVVIGITASGRTPYPIGALQYAQSIGAYTISLSCNKQSAISNYADCSIEVVVGPEVLTGSTRMKAGTAHKMILNMISTTVMVKMGKVYENLMVDLNASNHKLKERAKHTLIEITNVTYNEADRILSKTNFQVKPAIIMIEANVDHEKALEALQKCNGYVREAIDYLL
ncbi:N-acetylmuramic acid 6-phosphate etherase [Oceanobacillus salinisoli]|uniref:N-acetylmuramic acid 6-phosphate etherase n=1 Tax=Oceanobacillus salinisoli TaxID=2678611 RepID=UPI0012E149CA|nr:N-acetylmuramic acid 6-phosphate etherase [Oceanobacillus salinisoli]